METLYNVSCRLPEVPIYYYYLLLLLLLLLLLPAMWLSGQNVGLWLADLRGWRRLNGRPGLRMAVWSQVKVRARGLGLRGLYVHVRSVTVSDTKVPLQMRYAAHGAVQVPHDVAVPRVPLLILRLLMYAVQVMLSTRKRSTLCSRPVCLKSATVEMRRMAKCSDKLYYMFRSTGVRYY